MAFKMRGYSAFTKTDDKKNRLTKSIELQKGENIDTETPKSPASNVELKNDLEDRIAALKEDVVNGVKTKKEVNPALRKLRKRLGYLRQNK